MAQIERHLYGRIKKQLYKGKTILVFGARRVGKTHLIKRIIAEEGGAYFNGENLQTRVELETTSLAKLKELIGNHKLVGFDEVQSIPKIGLTLKLIHDTFPDVQCIATGSSAFELRDATAEPLTGRTRVYYLYPYAYSELREMHGSMETSAKLENMLRYGLYPEVYQTVDENERIEELMNIAANYLYKDVLMHGQLKRPDLILNILKLLAFQIGKEVSLNEISNKTDTSVHTVRRYLDLLEKSYVITSLGSLSRNLRNEIGKSRKYYFIDLGIRNALINNFNQLHQRNDNGSLWENFCVLERIKKNEYSRNYVNSYFWRTYQQQEIDYIEEYGGTLHAYEFKWSDVQSKPPRSFMETYPGSEFSIISRDNFTSFV